MLRMQQQMRVWKMQQRQRRARQMSAGGEGGDQEDGDHQADGGAAQHNAARGNHEGVATMLLGAGADAAAENAAGKAPGDLCDRGTALHTLLRRAAGGDE